MIKNHKEEKAPLYFNEGSTSGSGVKLLILGSLSGSGPTAPAVGSLSGSIETLHLQLSPTTAVVAKGV